MGANTLECESSRDRKFPDHFAPGSESSREREGQGVKWPRSEKAKEQKFQGVNWPGYYCPMPGSKKAVNSTASTMVELTGRPFSMQKVYNLQALCTKILVYQRIV